MIYSNYRVLVLDDDPSLLRSLERLLSARGYAVSLYSNAEEFFQVELPESAACLLLDINLGDGMTGHEVYAEIIRRGASLPVIFMTAHWDVQTVVNAIRNGVDDFVVKPLDPELLLNAVVSALQRSLCRSDDDQQVEIVRARAATLTARELEVVRLVMKGFLNKEIADQLGLALVTVKLHRGRAVKKMGAGNPLELARFATLAGLCA